MDRIHDSWKKHPVVVLGQNLRELGLEALPSAETVSGLPQSIDCFVLVVTADSATTLQELEIRGFQPDQILFLYQEEIPLLPEGSGALAWVQGEAPEIFRARLFAQIESQRRECLARVLRAHEAQHKTTQERLEIAYLTHALALVQILGPQQHALAIRAALEDAPHALPWPAQSTLPDLLAQAAALGHQAKSQATFREIFREASALLPFRLRSELKEGVEKIFASVWGGKSRAA